jgi:hypothetical protein
MSDIVATMMAAFISGWPEPPDIVVLRILGLDCWRPTDHETVKRAFQAKMTAQHPEIPTNEEPADANAAVQELFWARDVLLRKIPEPVTTDKDRGTNFISSNSSDSVTTNQGDGINLISRYRSGCQGCKGQRLDHYGNPYPLYEPANPRRGKKAHRYAGYCWACGYELEKAKLHEKRRQARADRTCESCGATFTPGRNDGRFCSSACRQAAYRKRTRRVTTAASADHGDEKGNPHQ